jgi:hypothetical protein
MGELIKLEVTQAPAFSDTAEMLNTWWKGQKAKPLVKPARIRHIVELALNAGWTLEDCYLALDTTWAFTESAFETALRKQKEEQEDRYGKLGKRILRLRRERKGEKGMQR